MSDLPPASAPEPNHFGVPPWKNSETWSQVVYSIEHLVGFHQKELLAARDLSLQIDNKYRLLGSSIDAVCGVTCVSCMDVCCKKATIWYDFKDLLFIYLQSGQLPEGQIGKKTDLSCCNLTSTGCTLPRSKRPFICTWYMCPSQISAMSAEEWINCGSSIQSSITEIKHLRNRLEKLFIETIA